MKLATLRSDRRDGTLIVVSRDLRKAVAVPQIAATLQAAIDDWHKLSPQLQSVYERLNTNDEPGAFEFNPDAVTAPLPRAYQWCDASTYVAHLERMSRWRGLELTKVQLEVPLIYQGGSDYFLGATEPIRCFDEAWGIDFESELAVITDDIPMGTTADQAGKHILLFAIVNDVSLRNLIASEVARGFGAYQCKPASSFAPVVVTPDELGDAWDGRWLHLPMVTTFRGSVFGRPNAGVDSLWGIPDIIAHAAVTRDIGAGTIFGAGTVANRDASLGSSCITERRTIEAMETGQSKTDYMRFGDSVRIEMFGKDGRSIFGAIDQKVVKANKP